MMRAVRRCVLPVMVLMGTILGGMGPVAAGPSGTAIQETTRVAVAEGEFVAALASAPALSELPGRRCQVVATGRLIFSGTLVGEARGTTTAIVLKPCSEVDLVELDFRDVFRFEGAFSGTVDGEPVAARLTYAGVTSPGGDIDALIHLGTATPLILHAEAVVAVGGTYTSDPVAS